MPKIAFLSHLDWNVYLFRLSWLKALKDTGYDTYAIVPPGEYSTRIEESGIPVISYDLIRSGINPLKEAKTAWELYKIFKHYQFDALFTFTLKPNIYGSIIGRMAGIPAIVNFIEGLGYFFVNDSVKVKIARQIIKSLYRIAFRISSKVVFMNEDDVADMRVIISNFSKLVRINGTGVDASWFRPEKAEEEIVTRLKETLNLTDRNVVVTMIARMCWNKGVREFVEASEIVTEEHPNVLFLLVGPPYRDSPDAIDDEYVEGIKLRKSIKLMGKVDHVREILYVTDIFVLPSYREGLSRTILEAMCMQKPVITTDVPGCRDLIDNGINGNIVPPRDPFSLAESIVKLINDEHLRKRMGKEGRKKVLTLYSEQKVLQEVLAFTNSFFPGFS